MSITNYITENDIDKIASETGKKLSKQKKVRIFINGDSATKHWEGGINGHFFRFPCNEFVEVPEDLATLIEQSAQVIREKQALEAKLTGDGLQLGGGAEGQEGAGEQTQN